MNKWYGEIGFTELKETAPGSWAPVITKQTYYGDVIKNTRKLQSASQLNDNINVSNEISIIADPFANENFHTMTYATFMGAKWRITSVDATQPPRLILSLGGVYNE